MTLDRFNLFSPSGQLRADELNRLARAVEMLGRPTVAAGLRMAGNASGVAVAAAPQTSGGGPTVTAAYLNSTNFATFGPVTHFGGNPGASDAGQNSSINLPGFAFPLTAGTNVVLASVVLGSFQPGNLQWDLFMGLFLPPYVNVPPLLSPNIVGAQVIYHRWPASAQYTLTTAPITYVGVVTGQPAGTYAPVFYMLQSDDYTNTAPDTVTVQVFPQSWCVLSF